MNRNKFTSLRIFTGSKIPDFVAGSTIIPRTEYNIPRSANNDTNIPRSENIQLRTTPCQASVNTPQSQQETPESKSSKSPRSGI